MCLLKQAQQVIITVKISIMAMEKLEKCLSPPQRRKGFLFGWGESTEQY